MCLRVEHDLDTSTVGEARNVYGIRQTAKPPLMGTQNASPYEASRPLSCIVLHSTG